MDQYSLTPLANEAKIEASPHSADSSLREQALGHMFLSQLLAFMWRNGARDIEVLKSEVDRGGYDVEWPFWKRVALGGFPYPTSEDASDAPELILFMKFPFLGLLISGKSKIAAVFVALHRAHWLRFKVYCLDDRRRFSSLETRKIQKFKKSSEGLLVAG